MLTALCTADAPALIRSTCCSHSVLVRGSPKPPWSDSQTSAPQLGVLLPGNLLSGKEGKSSGPSDSMTSRFDGMLEEFRARGPPPEEDKRMWAQIMRARQPSTGEGVDGGNEDMDHKSQGPKRMKARKGGVEGTEYEGQ
eukprot:1160515-Pelagomonas_calceolata.AAC.10